MGFFNSLRNIKRWFTDKTGITRPSEPSKRKHDECETVSNKRIRMDNSLVEVVEISDESLSETEEVEIIEPGQSTVPLRASPPVRLVDGRHHEEKTIFPTRTNELTGRSNSENKVKIVRSHSLTNRPLISNQTMGVVRSVSYRSGLEDTFLVKGSRSSSSMEGGFSALSLNNSTACNDSKEKVLAMILKSYVLPKSENTDLSASSSKSPSSQSPGKENLENITELSHHKNRIIKNEMFYDRILRKFKEKQEASTLALAALKLKSPEDIFRDKLETMRIELEKIEPKKKIDIFPGYSKEVFDFIKCQMSKPPNELIVAGKNIRISDLRTLHQSNGWLNDEVINHYLSLIINRDPDSLHTFDTFFYTKLSSQGYQSVRRWSRKKDIFACKKMFSPIHLGNHWCLICVNFIDKTIKYYDSLKGKNPKCLNIIFNYLKEEFKNKKNEEFDCTGWRLMDADDCPSQLNGYDCGVFSCVNAEFLARDAKLDFTQDDMPMLRRKLCYEILKNRLCY